MWPGIYRGVVVNNADPEGKLKIKAFIPQVLGGGTESGWIEPCLPPGWASGLGTVHDTYTGGGSFTLVAKVPPINSGVWIMFEGGDIDHPVWLGGWV
jgi:hypothetical protein